MGPPCEDSQVDGGLAFTTSTSLSEEGEGGDRCLRRGRDTEEGGEVGVLRVEEMEGGWIECFKMLEEQEGGERLGGVGF